MRITINNYAEASLLEVSQIVKDIDEEALSKFKHYSFWSRVVITKRHEVYTRKTRKGIAIDIHKMK